MELTKAALKWTKVVCSYTLRSIYLPSHVNLDT